MRLVELTPAWLAIGADREQMGMVLECPTHGPIHRIRVWFANPADGGPPVAPEAAQGPFDVNRLVWLAHCCEWEELTIIPANGNGADPIQLGDHFRGWLVDGQLVESMVTGVAW